METTLSKIPHIIFLSGFVIFLLGILGRDNVNQKIGDFWTILDDLKWGELIHKDAVFLLELTKKYFGVPSETRFYFKVFIISLFLNLVFLSSYFFINFNTRVNVNGNEHLLFIHGILAPGIILDTFSFVVTFFAIYMVSRLTKGTFFSDIFVYLFFILIDIFIVLLCISSASYVYEVMQISVGKIVFEYFKGPSFTPFLFIQLLLDSFFGYLKSPYTFFYHNLGGHLYVGGKYGAPFWPVILCILTTAIPTVVHLSILMSFSALKLFKSIFKPMSMFIAEQAYNFGGSKFGKSLEWWGTFIMVCSGATGAFLALQQSNFL